MPKLASWAVVFLLLTASVRAGFGGGGVTAVPIADSPISKSKLEKFDQALAAWMAAGSTGTRPTYPEFEDVPQSKIDSLKPFPPFAGKSDAEIAEKVRQMRRAMLCVIDLIHADNPAAGRGLERLLGLGKICFGLSRDNRALGATIFPDGKADFGTEPINIFYSVCEDLDLTDEETFKLYVALTHESLHGLQTIVRPTGRVRTVREAVDLQCREIEAHQGEVTQYDEIIRLLEHFRDNGSLPADAKGGTRKFAEAVVRANAAAGNNNLLTAWLRWLAAERQQRSYIVRFRMIYKEAGEAKIAGTLDADQLQRDLKPFRPWVEFYGNNRDFRILQTIIYNPDAPVIIGAAPARQITPPGNTIRQVSEENAQQTDFVASDCDSVTDGWIDETNNKFYYSGIRFGTGGGADTGVVSCYDLDPASQTIIGASHQTCIETPDLGGGCRLVENPFTDECYALTPVTGELHVLTDTTSDGCFDSLIPAGACPQGPGFEVGDAFCSDAHTIWGCPDSLDSCPDLLQPICVATRPAPANPFGGPQPFPWKDILITDPSVGTLPYEGRDDLFCVGTPGRACDVWYEPPGGPPRNVGGGTFSWAGTGCFDLSEPIGEDPIRIIDGTGARSTLIRCAPLPSPPINVGDPVFEGGEFRFSVQTFPGESLDGQSSGSPGAAGGWSTGPVQRADCFGGACFHFDPGPGEPRGFFRASSSADQSPPTPDPFTFTATSGVTSCIDLNISNCFKVVLDSDPGLHPDVFQLTPDGKLTITPINLAEDYSITYHLVFDLAGVIAGMPFTIVIEGDTKALTDPPVIEGSVPPQVEALFLPYNGELFPLYQFWVRNSPGDTCQEPHWHSIFLLSVYSIENPSTPVADPNPIDPCGFGKRVSLAPVKVVVPVAVWEDFKTMHPPNPSVFPP